MRMFPVKAALDLTFKHPSHLTYSGVPPSFAILPNTFFIFSQNPPLTAHV